MERTNSDQAWNALFSSLAFAEKAAADECIKIAKQFKALGLDDLAEEYEGLAQEEIRHHDLALSVTKEMIPLTDIAKTVYDGGFFSKNGSIVEQLISVHFVFEPSALAFLGYISRHSRDLFADQEWAEKITKAFNQILRDEVHHVQDGGEIIKRFWSTATREERKTAIRTMRKHRAFLKAGLLSFFSSTDIEKQVVSKMLSRFDFYFERATGGVLNANTTEIAS